MSLLDFKLEAQKPALRARGSCCGQVPKKESIDLEVWSSAITCSRDLLTNSTTSESIAMILKTTSPNRI